jgi:hypothetical protein
VNTEADSAIDQVDGPRPIVAFGPELVVGAGLILAIISLYLPWWGYDMFSNTIFSIGFIGFADWGIGYFIIWAVSACLLSLRTICRGAAPDFTLAVGDWYVYAVSGVLLLLFALIPLDDVVTEGAHFGLRYGWFVAMAAALLVLGGALWLRSDSAAPTEE